MAKTNTKDYILAVSLELLNQLGEANVTAVNLADELEISPGNLYYHYKGKGEIIRALLDRYEDALRTTFSADEIADRSPLDNWLGLYVLMEQIYRYRFLYRNPAELLARYPELAKSMGRIFLRLYNCVSAMMESIVDPQGENAVVSTDMVLIILMNWLNYREIVIPQGDRRLLIKSGMSRLASIIVPYCSEQLRAAIQICNEEY